MQKGWNLSNDGLGGGGFFTDRVFAMYVRWHWAICLDFLLDRLMFLIIDWRELDLFRKKQRQSITLILLLKLYETIL